MLRLGAVFAARSLLLKFLRKRRHFGGSGMGGLGFGGWEFKGFRVLGFRV